MFCLEWSSRARPTLNQLRAIISTLHMATKFLVKDGTIIVVNPKPKVVRVSYAQSLKVISYLVKAPFINRITHKDKVLEFPEEQHDPTMS